MDYSMRCLKRRRMFPVKVSTVQWSSNTKPSHSQNPSPRSKFSTKHTHPLNPPFFTRKMTQFAKKNQTSQCIKLLQMLRKLESQDEIRALAVKRNGNGERGGGGGEKGFPKRTNWRLHSAKQKVKTESHSHQLLCFCDSAKRVKSAAFRY